MKTYVALLRGINVGGRNSLPMKKLVEILTSLGCREVRTYIQSGNVVLRYAKTSRALARRIRTELQQRRGFDPHVIVLERAEFDHAIEKNPFGKQAPGSIALHLGFMDAAPERPDLQGLETLRAPTEKFELIGSVFYLLAPDGIGRSKLAAKAEKLLGRPLTDRNWKTVCKISAMLGETP